jgi:glycine/D-amino acid oxidase-like deaminating enzyme
LFLAADFLTGCSDLPMTTPITRNPWGVPPWEAGFRPPKQALPAKVDFAVIGGGFTGLAAAAWLRLLAPTKSVALVEAERIGAGASGRTGGMTLAESAAGDLPGLGDVLAGLTNILKKLGEASGTPLVDLCELHLNGAYEVGRTAGRADSPIRWNDSGNLRVVNEVPGGTLHPAKLVAGLAKAAVNLGVILIEDAPVTRVKWDHGAELELAGGPSVSGKLFAARALFATNGLSLGLSGLDASSNPRLTLAAATEPLREDQIEAIGLGERKPFYTIDFPYLWGRVCRDNSIVWGAGLVSPSGSKDLREIDISRNEPAKMFASLQQRVHRLHPALAKVRFTHLWGGPILFRDDWQPVFIYHPQSRDGIVLGAYAGHGVALSSYLGAWAAEALLGRRELPEWGSL